MVKDAPQPYWGESINWHLPADQLVPLLRRRAETEPYIWHPKPIDFAVGIGHSTPLQEKVFQQLSTILTSDAIGGSQRPLPNRRTPVEKRPDMVMMFGDGKIDARIGSVGVYMRLSAPKPPFLLVNTVDHLPPVDFHIARRQLVAGACNNGVVFEGRDSGNTVSGALWASMQGNYAEIRKPHQEILEDVIRRILAHYGTTYVTERHDGGVPERLTWETWQLSPIHRETAEAAWALGEAGVIQNAVKLTEYYEDFDHVKSIEKALNKSLGESMRAQFDEHLRVMGVTVSGGGKVEVSDDPRDGHLVPVMQITQDGYAVVKPRGGIVKKYKNGSVETFEAGKIILNAALALGRIATNFPEAERWLTEQFSTNGAADIVPEGLIPMITVVDHSHWHLEDYDPDHVEVVRPDPRYYPTDIDFACGSLDAANATASGLWLSEALQNPGPPEDPLRGKVLVIELGGHGMIVVGDDREKVTRAILHDMKLKPPEWV